MTKRQEILALLEKTPGLTVNDIAAAVGMARPRAHGETWRLAQIGALFVLAAKPCARHYASAEQAEAARAGVDAETAAYLARRKEEKLALRRVKDSKRKRPSPSARGKPTAVRSAATRAQAFKTQQASNPRDVQVQRVPGVERVYDRRPERIFGVFSTLGIGKYL